MSHSPTFFASWANPTRSLRAKLKTVSLKPLQVGLLSALSDAQRLLVIPQNDFQYSKWKDSREALAEIGRCITEVQAGQIPRMKLLTLFSPSGPLQDVSMGSGWQHQFVELAVRADKLLNPKPLR